MSFRAIRRLFATYITTDCNYYTNSRNFKNFAKKMGTSVKMIMNTYAQMEDDDADAGEYHRKGF